MRDQRSRPLGRMEFYLVMTVVFLLLVAVHHAPRASTEIQHTLTGFLIVMATATIFMAWRSKPARTTIKY